MDYIRVNVGYLAAACLALSATYKVWFYLGLLGSVWCDFVTENMFTFVPQSLFTNLSNDTSH